MKNLFLIISLTACSYLTFSQVSFFRKDTIEYFFYTTDSSQKFGCYHLNKHTDSSIITCNPIKKYILIHINDRKEVFWFDRPFKNREFKIDGRVYFSDHYVDPYPLFKVFIRKNKIVYKSLVEPYRESVQYSLNKKDTISQQYDLSGLFSTNPPEENYTTMKKVFFVKDTSITIDGKNVYCYLFKGFYDPLDYLGLTVCLSKILIEKESLLPIYINDNEFLITLDENRNITYTLMRSFTTIPKNLINKL